MAPTPSQDDPGKARAEPERETTLLRLKRLTTRLFGLNRDEYRKPPEDGTGR